MKSAWSLSRSNTNWLLRRPISEVGRDLVYSMQHGNQRKTSGRKCCSETYICLTSVAQLSGTFALARGPRALVAGFLITLFAHIGRVMAISLSSREWNRKQVLKSMR